MKDAATSHDLKALLSRLPLRQVTADDYGLFESYFNRKEDAGYADSWTYLLQAINGYGLDLNPLGYVHQGPDVLVAVGLFVRPIDGALCFHLVNPLGSRAAPGSSLLATEIRRHCSFPIYLKKCDPAVQTFLIRSRDWYHAVTAPWHQSAPMEDDTLPEVILSVEDSLGLVEQDSELRDKIRRFAKRQRDSAVVWCPMNSDDGILAEKLVFTFFAERSHLESLGSSPGDYRNMLRFPGGGEGRDLIRELLFIDECPAALLIAERIQRTLSLALYCNLALYHHYQYVSEVAIIRLLRLARDRGYTRINMGGSETPGLDRFKNKFRPIAAIERPWLLYDHECQ